MRYLFVACCAITLSCQTRDPATATSDTSDFEAFYQQFHTDSTFQLERTIFPLSGLPANADSLTLSKNDYKWTKDNWVLHRPFDSTLTGFEHKLTELGEGMILETFLQKDTRMAMERRFAIVDGNWHLIYYAGMNPVGQ